MKCKKCGKENPDDSKFCCECGKALMTPKADTSYAVTQSKTAKPFNAADPYTSRYIREKKEIRRKKLDIFFASTFIIIMCVLGWCVIGHYMGWSENKTPSTVKYTYSVASYENSTEYEEPTEEYTEATTSAKDFKASCRTIPYKDIARQPMKYMGENVVYTGQIVQVGKANDDLYYARINVTKDEYGYYDDTMYVYYMLEENEPKFLEDDIVTFYGECKGEMSYESILGEEITIPEVSAKYIELVK